MPKKVQATLVPGPKKPGRPRGLKKLPYPGWTPMKGVSQSLLQYFSCDTDRFHKKAVLGLRSTDRKEAMEYGTIFHKLIELGSKMGDTYTPQKMMVAMKKYIDTRFPLQESKFLARVAIAQYNIYREWEKTRPKYRYIDSEPVFKEDFRLPALRFKPNDTISINIPPGIVIPMRGRIDEVIDNGGMWIQENKTKSRIDLQFIRDTLHKNIQVMFYAVCAELKYGRPCKGVIYNIIRKPGQRRRTGRGNAKTGAETEDQFLARIEDDIRADPEYYFMRLRYEFPPGAVEKWKREELLPLLYRVYIWWKSIEANPTNPWVDAKGNVNPFHGRKSFGIFDAMSQGKGDYYDLIVYNRKRGLVIDYEMFPELQEEDDD